jgi:PAS domain S-box-containing protein
MPSPPSKPTAFGIAQAEATLADLARIFLQPGPAGQSDAAALDDVARSHARAAGTARAADARAAGDSAPAAPGQARDWREAELPANAEARYRALVEQIPAVIFMAYLDKGIGEAYVSPQIEAALGFSQQEWLEDPVRWYQHIHPDDKARWSVEAAQMFLSGQPLRSAYRVIARDGRVIWFHCQATMIRREDGRPWFIHGVGVDITDLKNAEAALQEERNVVSAILDTVGALVVVLDPDGRIVRFNRASELTSGFNFEEVHGRYIWDLFLIPEELARFKAVVLQWRAGGGPSDYDSHWVTTRGGRRMIAWSGTVLRGRAGQAEYIIATGLDVTERKRLEHALLDSSGREQRRIGQDLHDGLGQHLTGTAFMSKALQQRLAAQSLPEAADAGKIVTLVNQAIEKTRELSRGLLPVVSDADGLMSALERWAGEVEDLFGVTCRFTCETPVLIDNVTVATHLFHVAQEAVTNGIKHGLARHIRITLDASGGAGHLIVEDDGAGMPGVQTNQPGMGLLIMSYRANMIGGSLDVRRGPNGGTTVDCIFPLPNHS